MKTLKQLLILLFVSLLPFIISNCEKDDDTDDQDMTYFKDSLGCFPNQPSPNLISTGKEEVHRGADGNVYIYYKLSIKNCASFPGELFVLSPDLSPCGLNTKASRT